MQHPASVFTVLGICLSVAAAAQSQAPPDQRSLSSRGKPSPAVLAAKTVFFEDRSDVPAVGKAALDELKKWRRLQIVSDKSQANLALLLSTSPPRGGHIIYSGGQTGTVEKGTIDEDSVPTYPKSGPVREVYLTVFDPHSGQIFWSDSHRWGGLLTGFNSAGARLISQFKKWIEK